MTREQKQKFKKAIKEHRTIVACTITAIVVARITKKSVVATAVKNITPIITELEHENDILELQLELLVDFINHNDLAKSAMAHLTSVQKTMKVLPAG